MLKCPLDICPLTKIAKYLSSTLYWIIKRLLEVSYSPKVNVSEYLIFLCKQKGNKKEKHWARSYGKTYKSNKSFIKKKKKGTTTN